MQARTTKELTNIQEGSKQEHKAQKPMQSDLDKLLKGRDTSEKREYYDQVNVRLPSSLNDWLNDSVRKSKRVRGTKVPKEMIIEVALEYFRALEIDWGKIESKRDLLDALNKKKKVSNKKKAS